RWSRQVDWHYCALQASVFNVSWPSYRTQEHYLCDEPFAFTLTLWPPFPRDKVEGFRLPRQLEVGFHKAQGEPHTHVFVCLCQDGLDGVGMDSKDSLFKIAMKCPAAYS
ncbi:unnamed protein product, partial [Aphanomyces euteiches]